MNNLIQKIQNRIINGDLSLFDALKRMDRIRQKVLFVFDGDKFRGMLTIGDIQRAIIKKNDTGIPVSEILDTDKIMALENEPLESIKRKMSDMRAECMPVLDEKGELADVLFWEDLFVKSEKELRKPIDLPVVIMAGGTGTRLKPLTNVIPKPLIPIGEKTILEEIMDRFAAIGCDKFYLSLNYKYNIIEYYLGSLEHKYNISVFKEDKPLGTIGGISLLKEKIKTPFFVSNCDILIDQDLRDVYEYHVANKNDITIITALKSIRIPYGVIETGENGIMTGLKEKPEMTYMINTGIYILQPELIGVIPENELFHITQLMQKVQDCGGKVGCFPITENSWKDMGEWSEYLKMIGIR